MSSPLHVVDAAPDPLELDTSAQSWLDAYRTAKANAAAWEEIAKRAREQLEAALGDHTAATVDGRRVVTFAWSKPAERLDVRRLRRELPQVAEEYTTLGQPVRSLRFVEDEQ